MSPQASATTTASTVRSSSMRRQVGDLAATRHVLDALGDAAQEPGQGQPAPPGAPGSGAPPRRPAAPSPRRRCGAGGRRAGGASAGRPGRARGSAPRERAGRRRDGARRSPRRGAPPGRRPGRRTRPRRADGELVEDRQPAADGVQAAVDPHGHRGGDQHRHLPHRQHGHHEQHGGRVGGGRRPGARPESVARRLARISGTTVSVTALAAPWAGGANRSASPARVTTVIHTPQCVPPRPRGAGVCRRSRAWRGPDSRIAVVSTVPLRAGSSTEPTPRVVLFEP